MIPDDEPDPTKPWGVLGGSGYGLGVYETKAEAVARRDEQRFVSGDSTIAVYRRVDS